MPTARPANPAEQDPRLFSFYLRALHELGSALTEQPSKVESARPLRESLYRIMGTFAIGRGLMMLRGEQDAQLEVACAKGLRPGKTPQLNLNRTQLKQLASSTRPFHPHMPTGGLESLAQQLRPLTEKHEIQWIVPLATGTSFVGLLLLGPCINRKTLSSLEIDVLEEMAGVLGLRIDDARARAKLASQVRKLQRINRQMHKIYLETVRTLAGVIDGPHDERRGPSHSLRVASLASAIARHLKLGPQRCQGLYVAGLLHDMGKQIIDQQILGKPGPLTDQEWQTLEKHPALACELISHLQFPWGDVAEIIRHHHERLDGRGYPDRLQGPQISLEAKILMMAEAFDSMTSDQPWRTRLPMGQIVEQISRNLGIQFEPQVVQALCAVVEEGLMSDDEGDELDFMPHLEANFDPSLIRKMIQELRNQIHTPTCRPPAAVVELVSEQGQ